MGSVPSPALSFLEGEPANRQGCLKLATKPYLANPAGIEVEAARANRGPEIILLKEVPFLPIQTLN
jgi:hypothetical protein